jgi:hypothetical protein
MADPIQEIGSTSYDFDARALELAKGFFNIEETNILKVGLLGYMTALMSDAVSTSVFHRNVLYREFFLNTARLPRSVYNSAKLNNFDIAFATPSNMRVNFALRKEEAIRYSEPQLDGSRLLIIDRNQPFFAGAFQFMLPRSVRLTLTPAGGSYAVTATYDTVGVEDSLPVPSNPYVRTWSQEVENEVWLFMELVVYQMERVVKTFSVYSEDISDNLIYLIDFPKQMSSFDVFYKHSRGTQLLPKYFNDLRAPADTEKFCFYTFRDRGQLQVYFSATPGSFRPEFNSELTVAYYVTEGSKGVFDFTGDLQFKFDTGKLARLQPKVTPLTGAVGGVDTKNLLEIKKSVIEYQLSRGSIINETDINLFFERVASQNSQNGSRFLFLKKRDDVLRRLISCYALMRDFNRNIIPTNTFHLQTSLAQLTALNSVIPSGSQVIYDKVSKLFRLMSNVEVPAADDYVYSIPYMMIFRDTPFPRIAYYRNMMSEDIPAPFTFVNYKINNEFIISDVHLERNSSLVPEYKVSFSLTTNMAAEEMQDVIVRGVLKKDGAPYGFFDFEKTQSDSNYLCTATLYTDDTFNSGYRMALVGSLSEVLSGTTIPRTYVDEDMSIEIGLLHDGGIDFTRHGTFIDMTDVEEYATMVVYETAPVVSLFKSMNVVSSNFRVDPETGNVAIHSVPAIGYEYYSNLANYKDIYSLLDAFESMLRENKGSLENNTDMDLKFYNTWGPSKYFNSGTTDLFLKLKIKLRGLLTQRLDTEIRKFIVDTIEASNVSVQNEQRRFSVSNLIRGLEQEFPLIVYIEFDAVNGNAALQNVLATEDKPDDMTAEQLINHVPEYLNVGMDRNSYLSPDRRFTPRIDITYL